MHELAAVALFAVTPSPSPSPVVDPDLVTPGPWGFTAIAFIAAAVTLLVTDMLRRVRRARYREQVAAELDAEQAASAEQTGGAEHAGAAEQAGASGSEAADDRGDGPADAAR